MYFCFYASEVYAQGEDVGFFLFKTHQHISTKSVFWSY
jgi:hypothetical protein